MSGLRGRGWGGRGDGGRSRHDDLRPSWEERRAALERARDRILHRQDAEERRRLRVRIGVPLATLGAFALGVAVAGPLARHAAAARPDLFAVRHVAVSGAERLAPGEIARVAGLDGASPGASMAPEAIAARVAAHPWIASARAARVAPDTVLIRIVERRPSAVLVRADGPPLLVDAGGTPFVAAEGPAAALPRLVLTGPVAPGVREPRLASAIALADALAAAGWPEATIELEGPEARALPALRIPGLAPRVVLGADGVPSEQLARLARVLAEVPESREAVEIDLRFADQVVLRPAPPEPGAADREAAGAGAPAPSDGDRTG